MATGNFTTTTSAAFIPEIWSQFTKVAVEENLVVANLVTRDLEADISNEGDTVHVPTLSNLTAATKSAGSDVTYSNVTETTVDVTIDQHKYVAFVVEDITAIQANTNLLQKYTGKAGYALAHDIDAALLALYSSAANSGGGASAITDAYIRAAIEYLDVANVPEEGRALVLHPTCKTDMLGIDKFVRMDYVNGAPTVTGQFGEIYGIPVFITTNVVSTTAASVTTYHNLLLHREAIALAVQSAPRVQSDNDIDKLGTKVVADVLYGLGVLRDDFMVDISSI